MRYPCIGFPSCLKTFENGHVLRGHQLSCEHAQKEIKSQQSRQEHAREIRYDCDTTGMKNNKYYPTFAGIDHTQRLHFRDRSQLGGSNKGEYRRLLKPADSSKIIPQTKSTAMDFSGYYT